MMYWFEREEQDLCDAFNRGEISQKEFNDGMRDLRQQYQAVAEEEAQEAYNKVIERYY